jgi:hypothetical protein
MEQESNLHLIFTAKRLYNKAQGRAAHPGLMNCHLSNPNGVLQTDVVKPRWGLGRGDSFVTQGALRDPGLCCITALRFEQMLVLFLHRKLVALRLMVVVGDRLNQ